MVRSLVVFESLWGNTEKVARAVARGLAESMDVDVMDVSENPPLPDDSVVLLLAGGPTHAFSMTRPRTRAEARTQGATQGLRGPGLREWIGSLSDGHHDTRVATFDTRVSTVRHLPGSAAKSAEREVKRRGYTTLPRQSFWVEGSPGPLVDGELDRATAWGRTLAATVREVTR